MTYNGVGSPYLFVHRGSHITARQFQTVRKKKSIKNGRTFHVDFCISVQNIPVNLTYECATTLSNIYIQYILYSDTMFGTPR